MFTTNSLETGRTPTHHREFRNGKYPRQLLSEKEREGRAYTQGRSRNCLVSSPLISLQGDLGEPFVLEPQDESPFVKFGYVQPGQTIPALYSNLIRAPLFRHKSYPTDFLVIKSVISSLHT